MWLAIEFFFEFVPFRIGLYDWNYNNEGKKQAVIWATLPNDDDYFDVEYKLPSHYKPEFSLWVVACDGGWLNIKSVEAEQEDSTAAPDEYHSKISLLIAMCEGPVQSISCHKFDKQPIENFRNPKSEGGGPLVSASVRYGESDDVYANQIQFDRYVGSTNTDTMDITLSYNTPYTYNGLYTNTNEFLIRFDAPAGFYRKKKDRNMYSYWKAKVKVQYREAPSGSWITHGYIKLSGSSPKPFWRWYKIGNLKVKGNGDQWDLRLTKITKDEDGSEYFGSVKVTEINEVEYGNKIYPSTALVSMEIIAGETSLVAGKVIRVPDLKYGGQTQEFLRCYYDSSAGEYKNQDGNSCTWDGSTLVEQFSDNPAWCCYDLLTNSRYGLGKYLSDSDLDLNSFWEVTSYQEKRYTLNAVIDSGGKAIDVMKQLLQSFNSFLVYNSGKVKIKTDKPGSPVQVFNMSNIVKDSFSVAYGDKENKPTSVQIQFLNQNSDYEKDTILIEDLDLVNSYGKNTATLSLFGVTKPSQVLRQARYLLNSSKYQNKVVEFSAGLDSIHCEVGDVIEVQHDAPQWNEGGRVVEATATHVYLGREVLLGTAGDYKILCQVTGDDIETHWIDATISGYVWDVTVTGAFSKVPPAEGKWVIGRDAEVSNPYKVTQISRNEDETRKITAIEYNSLVYDVTGDADSEVSYEFDPVTGNIPNQVSGLHAEVETNYYAAILLSWNNPEDQVNFAGVNLYVKTSETAADWNFWKSTKKEVARYSPIYVNEAYTFKAVSFNNMFEHARFDTAPTVSITVTTTGAEAIYEPPTITNLHIDNA